MSDETQDTPTAWLALENGVVLAGRSVGAPGETSGDLVFNRAFPFYDQNAGATSVGWRASLAAILEMSDADTLVIPGHGEIGDRSIVEAQIDYFDQLEEAVRAEIAEGQDLETVKAKRWPFMDGFAFERIAGTTIEGMYLEVTGQR